VITLRRSESTGLSSQDALSDRRTRATWLVILQLLVVLGTAAISIELRRRVPVQLNDSAYDGMLYARVASQIESGHWLGSFTQLTLGKGPGYPLFIAAAHRTGLELKVAEQLVYLTAVGATALALLLTTRRRWLALGAFVVLALDPASFSADSALVLRDNLFSSLGLLALSAAFLTFLGAARGSRWPWIVLGALTTGGASALYWLTREEGLTLFPPLGVLVVGMLAMTWWTRRRAAGATDDRRRWFVRPIAAVLLVVVAAGLPIVVVRAENESHYGVALTNDLTEGAFLRAYADWSRVEAGPARYRVPISADQRLAVYEVSSAARELRPTLEDPDNFWREFGCDHPEAGCDYAGGWMLWAVRDAASNAGHFDTAQDAQRFFTRLSEQISGACDDGALSCAPRLPGSLQALQQAPPRLMAHNFLALLRDVLLAKGMYDPPTGAAVVPDELRAEYTPVVDGIPADAVSATAQTAVFAPRIWQYTLLGAAYHVLVPLLLVLAVAGVCMAAYRVVRRRERAPLLLALVLAAGTGIVMREFLMALIQTAEYDADRVRYQLPSYFLLTALAMAGIGAGLRVREPEPSPVTGEDPPDAETHRIRVDFATISAPPRPDRSELAAT
jgi:hypothetical protein